MNHRGSQVALTEIVGRFDIGAVQEDEQAILVLSIPAQKDRCLGSAQGTSEQLIAAPLGPSDLSEELWRRELVSHVMQMDG